MTPGVTKTQLVDYLKSKNLGVEIFEEIPTDETNVRHGIYVSNPMIASIATPISGFKGCGNVVIATDNFDIVVVSFQDDDKLSRVADVITDLPYATILGEYSDVKYTTTRNYLNRAEYRVYSFDLERLEQE